MGKAVVIGSDARAKMKTGVDILADAVKATLGPRGRHAAIERRLGPPLITKDGVTVASHISLDNRLENMGAQLIKSVAAAANNMAGDGTTTATVLAQEIYNSGIKMIEAGHNPVLIKRGIDWAVERVVQSLKDAAIDVSDEETLARVATISANNDAELGKMIAEAVSAVGNDGVVSVEEATGDVTKVEYTDGLKLARGWLNEAFITNTGKMTCEMEDPLILLYDERLGTIHDIVPIINEVLEVGRPLFMIFKDIEPEALMHIVLNKVQGVINACVIKAPAFGDHRRGVFEDIAVLTGAKLYTNDDGRKLDGITIEHLGTARRIVCGPNVTTIVEGGGKPTVIEAEVSALRTRLKEPDIFDHQKAVIKARLSRLTGGVAVFKVGATSETEMKEKKDRVEDAINAVKSAIAEGVVSGGGSALLHCIPVLDDIDGLTEEEVAGVKIIREALKVPFKQILDNAGEKETSYALIDQISRSENKDGFDALKLEFVEDMIERGIVDPTRVVRSALEHAASASGTLLTTEVAIFESEDDSAS
jgi:chaperonin GroEL